MQPLNPAIADNTAASADEDSVRDLLREASCAETVETVIYSLESEKAAVVWRTSEGHLWSFPYGSVPVFVQLTGESEDDTFKVWAEVMHLPESPERRLKLMGRVLEMNWAETFEANFALFGKRLVVVTHRTVADLSPGEISRSIALVATLADDWDEALIEEFGGTPTEN